MLIRFTRPSVFNVTRLFNQAVPSYSADKTSDKLAPNKKEMLTIDWQVEGLLPQFFKGSMGAFFQRMTKDVEFEDKIFNYKIKDPYNLNIHLLKVRTYFRYKSPFNKIEYLGSVYYEGEELLTILWRLSSLKSNFLRYFPALITGRKPEYKTVEGALDIYVNSDARVYKMINRPATKSDFEAAKKFSELKQQNVAEAEEKEKDISIRVAKRIAEEKAQKQD